jgi:hypothetical protein
MSYHFTIFKLLIVLSSLGLIPIVGARQMAVRHTNAFTRVVLVQTQVVLYLCNDMPINWAIFTLKGIFRYRSKKQPSRI